MKMYRIRVSLREMELGYVDVDVLSSGSELRNVDTGEFVPLLDGRTLSIKFRLEYGITLPVTFEAAHGANGGADLTPQLPGVNVSGSNRLLICAVSSGRANANPLGTVSSFVLEDDSGNGAQTMIQLGGYYSAPADGARWSTWYLVAPTVGANRRLTVPSERSRTIG